MRYHISIQCSFDRRIPLGDVTWLKYHECNSPVNFTRGVACDELATCKTFPTGRQNHLRLASKQSEITKWRRVVANLRRDCQREREIPPHRVRVNISTLPLPLSGSIFHRKWAITLRFGDLNSATAFRSRNFSPHVRTGVWLNVLLFLNSKTDSALRDAENLCFTITTRLNSPMTSGKFTLFCS